MMLFVCHPKILRKRCFQFLLGVKMAPRETENNAYAEFWVDKQRALWYVIVFSGVVNWSLLSGWTKGTACCRFLCPVYQVYSAFPRDSTRAKEDGEGGEGRRVHINETSSRLGMISSRMFRAKYQISLLSRSRLGLHLKIYSRLSLNGHLGKTDT